MLFLVGVKHNVVADLFSDDGVLVEEKGDLFKISGFWTTLVTIHPPSPPDEQLWHSSTSIKDFINAQTSHLKEHQVRFWLARLGTISALRDIPVDAMDTVPSDYELNTEQPCARSRRGLMPLADYLETYLAMLLILMLQLSKRLSIIHVHNLK